MGKSIKSYSLAIKVCEKNKLLSGSFVTTAWRVLPVGMVGTASRFWRVVAYKQAVVVDSRQEVLDKVLVGCEARSSPVK
jgi:hypothetical protein